MGRGSKGGFMRGKPYADHAACAARMREHPGVWVEIGLYNSRATAQSVIRHMHAGTRIDAYLPVGSFRGQLRMVDDGYMVDGMYVGEQPGGGK